MLRNKLARFLLSFAAVLTLAAGQASAGQPPASPEMLSGVIQMVDVAGRQIRIAGTTYPLSSTVGLQWQSGQKLALRDLQAGMTVKFRVAIAQNGSPVVQQLVLTPD